MASSGEKPIPSVDYMSFEQVTISVDYLKEKTQYRPKIAIICGTGLGLHNIEY